VEGTPFGRYLLLDLLGRGGMGEVWRAFDTVTERVVALKVLPAAYAHDRQFQERFRREARAAAGVTEPHVVTILDFGDIDGHLYVTMPLIEGEDLQAVIDRGPLKHERAVKIIEQIASALHAAHRVGLVHRDVKPHNILIAEDDFAYLIDFGIAKAVGETGLTNTGATIGTWAYMAPERFTTTAEANSSSDVYALACVLYHCLTGQTPYPGTGIEHFYHGHVYGEIPLATVKNAEIPAALDTVIATGMAKNPDQRYPTTKHLAAAARAAVTSPVSRVVQTPAAPAQPAARPMPPSGQPMTPPPARATPVTPGQKSLRPSREPSPPVEAGISASSSRASSTTPPPVTKAAPVQAPPAPRKTPTPPPSAVHPPAHRPPNDTVHRAPQPGAPVAAPVVAAPLPRPWWRRKPAIITAVLAIVTIAVIAIATLGLSSHDTTPPVQSTLPFTGLGSSNGVAVGADDTVYVADYFNSQVLKLAPGATTPTELPFTGLRFPEGVAVGPGDTVYVADTGNNRVLKLAPGATTPTELPFTGLSNPEGVAVGPDDTVYVADTGKIRVLKLAPGATTPTELPFTGLLQPSGVAVGANSTVYVADTGNNRVLKLAPGATTQTELPFTGLLQPFGVAVGAHNTLYVTDTLNNLVLKLAAGSAP
jgi:serine/threonine protein kinase, bacterial